MSWCKGSVNRANRGVLVLLLALAVAGCSTAVPAGPSPASRTTPESESGQTKGPGTPGPSFEVRPGQVRQLLPRDAIAPIYDPQFIDAPRAQLADEELVLGVEINGESKAYPIGPLNSREMVNDVLGGVPILVTW